MSQRFSPAGLIKYICCMFWHLLVIFYMLFTKTRLFSKAQCVGHGFFLFDTENNHNTTETFIVEDLVIVY